MSYFLKSGFVEQLVLKQNTIKMKKKPFYQRIAGAIAIASMAWLPSQAANGSLEQPYQIFHKIERNEFRLTYHPRPGEIVKWVADDLVLSEDTILYFPYDLDVRLLVQNDTSWSYTDYSFQGIQIYSGDSLIAPWVNNASYYWEKDGQSILNNNHNYLSHPTSGSYGVNIVTPSGQDTLTYYYHFDKNHLEGTSKEHAILDQSILSLGHRAFFVDANGASEIVWSGVKGNTNGSALGLFNDENGVVYGKYGNTWKKAAVVYKPIIRTGNSLGLEDFSTEKFQWFKNGQPLANANQGSFQLTSVDSALYSVKIEEENGNVYNFSYYFDGNAFLTKASAIHVPKLIKRKWDSFVIAPGYNATDIEWTLRKDQFDAGVTSTGASVAIQENALVRLTFRQGKYWYTSEYNAIYGELSYDEDYYKEDLSKPNSIRNPHAKIHMIATGNTVALPANVTPDSLFWTVKYEDGTQASYTTPTIQVAKNAIITALFREKGFWYIDIHTFYGITQDTLTGTLSAPIIQDAQYTWFRNDHPIGVTTPDYVPTQTGTYKVEVVWVETAGTGSGKRLEGTVVKAVFTFQVDKLPVLTGLESEGMVSSLALYPNPASDRVQTNLNGSFTYRIEDMRTNTVQTGNGEGNNTIDISSLKSGVYFVYVKVANAQSVKRLVVE